MVELCEAHAANSIIAIRQIAGKYAYTIDFTAPYWPQSQPVEAFWGNMKWCWRTEYGAADRKDVIAFVYRFFRIVAVERHEEVGGWCRKTDAFCKAVVDSDPTILSPLELELMG